ncbi:MAG: hypothetical protein C4562_04115 [Actinobacteria bacterium]|nr:MAG: hypothetical protein C4562_04115 [Actinomycetota bacterium]
MAPVENITINLIRNACRANVAQMSRLKELFNGEKGTVPRSIANNQPKEPKGVPQEKLKAIGDCHVASAPRNDVGMG